MGDSPGNDDGALSPSVEPDPWASPGTGTVAGPAGSPQPAAQPDPPPQAPDPYQQPVGYVGPGNTPPPYDWGTAYPADAPTGPPKTDGFAIASLILGVLGGVLLSVIFGIVALVRISGSRGTKKGRGLAITGLVLSAAWIVVVGVIIVSNQPPPRDPVSGAVTEPGRVSYAEVKVGDCIEDPPAEENVSAVTVVPCDQPHHQEAFATFELPDGDYPAAAQLAVLSEKGCTIRVPDDIDVAISDQLRLYFFYPLEGGWKLGDHHVLCMAASTDVITQPIAP